MLENKHIIDSPALHGLFIDALADGVAKGVVALAATGDGEVYQEAFGAADATAGRAMSLDTVFWVLSMTKAVTAVACMQLVEQGRVGLDQPAADILPELAAPHVLEGFGPDGAPRLRPAKRAITVRHLLTHTSGFTYSLWSQTMAQYEAVTGSPIIFSGKAAALAVPLEFDPGERWHYGISIDWVGRLVEAVTGQSLEIYFRENIFEPLQMRDTGFLMSSAQRARLATTWQRQPDGTLTPEPYESPQRPEFFMGGTGLFSTPRDYMAFLRMLMMQGRYEGGQILKAETVEAMMRNQIGELSVTEMVSVRAEKSRNFDLFPGETHKWGLSFDINERSGKFGRSAGSVAWAGALNTHYWIDPVAQVVGAMFVQVWPFYDEKVIALFNRFEETLYRGTRQG